MSLSIHPDPQQPAGGFAFLELPGGMLGDGPVMVAVMEVYGARWLGQSEAAGGIVTIGEGHWQGERHAFGPYQVHQHDGADWVRVGPEIVNKIEEYTPLRISIGDHEADVTWPDNVPPRAGAAVLGGLQPTARAAEAEPGAALVGQMQEPEPDPAPEPEPEAIAPDAPQEQPEPSSSMYRWAPVLILLIAGAAAGYWWFYLREQQVTPVAVVPQDTCTKDALAELDGFDATQKAIRACGDALSADTVLEIVEDAALRGDKDALLLFGTLYDGSEQDARIETVIGLSFAHDAATAAEYYARAHKAGSDEARARLTAICVQLGQSDETLAKGAYDDYCQ